MFDIVKQDYSKSAELGHKFEMKLPDGTSSGAFLVVIGDYSPVVKGYSRRKFEEFRQKQAIAKRKNRDQDDMSLDEAEDLAVEAALVRLIDWDGFTEDGKAVPFTKEKASAILKQHGFIREQIMNEAGDVSNFTPKTLKV